MQICISHFTMETYHGRAYNGIEDEWFRMQCATTMNVESWRCLDWAHGGLQVRKGKGRGGAERREERGEGRGEKEGEVFEFSGKEMRREREQPARGQSTSSTG